MECHYSKKIQNIIKAKKYTYKTKENNVKYKHIELNSNYKFIFYILILYFIIILLPFSLEKNFFRNLISVNQISLTINSTGLVQILSESFSYLPSSVTINGNETSLINRRVNLVSVSNIVIMEWNSPIIDCFSMFSGLNNISEIDLSNFTSSNVIDMRFMFNGCTKLEKIIFRGINTSNVEYMDKMFYYCLLLTSLDLSNFNTS